VKQLNESNELMSYVAVNKSNEDIIGHCALIREEISDFVEMGVAFVNPAYRGSGCLTDLSQIMLEDVEKMSFTGVFAHAVTTHNYSQKVIANFGFKESALLISRVSALQMNKINTENTTRDSLLYQCKYIDRPHLSKIFTPVHHHNMIVKILQNLGVDPLVGSVAEEVTLKDQDQPRRCMIETKTDAYACAHIFVKQYGNDIQLNVGKTLKSLCVDRIETVYLFLPLEFPETSIHCKDFEALGFFFSGVKPAKGHKAWLLLQYLNNQSYDYNKLVFCSDFGRELMSYIRKCDPNCEME
jgi:serine/threonine-protein kinase RsbW